MNWFFQCIVASLSLAGINLVNYDKKVYPASENDEIEAMTVAPNFPLDVPPPMDAPENVPVNYLLDPPSAKSKRGYLNSSSSSFSSSDSWNDEITTYSPNYSNAFAFYSKKEYLGGSPRDSPYSDEIINEIFSFNFIEKAHEDINFLTFYNMIKCEQGFVKPKLPFEGVEPFLRYLFVECRDLRLIGLMIKLCQSNPTILKEFDKNSKEPPLPFEGGIREILMLPFLLEMHRFDQSIFNSTLKLMGFVSANNLLKYYRRNSHLINEKVKRKLEQLEEADYAKYAKYAEEDGEMLCEDYDDEEDDDDEGQILYEYIYESCT